MVRTAGAEVPNGEPVQPFCNVSGVNELADLANETPSNEVKHAALLNAPPSAWTVTTPVGSICSRPLAALHRSTGTNTTLAGRNAAGRVNGTGLLPVVAMAPLKCTIPEIVRTSAAEVPNGEPVQPFCNVSGVNELADLANETPSNEVKHAALLNAPPSAWTVTTPVGSICSRPLAALHRSTGTNTTLAGRNAAGRVNGTGLLPVVAMAPLKCTIPEIVRTSAAEVPNGEPVQPFCNVSGVNELADLANETPSNEVKHAALLNAPPSAWTVTTPVGSICSRPLAALHRSTGTNTTLAGRNAAGRVNGTGLLPVVAMAPLKCTIPEIVRTSAAEVPNGEPVQPFCNTNGVQPLVSAPGADVAACAATVPTAPTGSVTTTTLPAQTASWRSPQFTTRKIGRAQERPAAWRLPPSVRVNRTLAI